jgi:hypothetical protein
MAWPRHDEIQLELDALARRHAVITQEAAGLRSLARNRAR